jgi:hypothetical protein
VGIDVDKTNIYRLTKHRYPVLIANVDLALVSNFGISVDERYPVKSADDGVVIGELRMTVTYLEVIDRGRRHYDITKVW